MIVDTISSPPQHRHNGTSPLPLGMDWIPAPRKWNGRDTAWPHNHCTGWSYCVTIPSWAFVPKSRNSDPIVFYRVQVSVQSPEGITRVHGVLRRFNDFLKLFADLKKEFPRKNIPPAPPKGLLRLKSQAFLEERRCSLEEWITKLLSDIDVSRCAAVASFLELKAARSSFQDASQQNSETDPDSNNGVYSVQSPLQRRLGTVKIDMEDHLVIVKEEITAKDFLAKKVKDLEVELETTKQKNKENLQQAVLIERERFTQMQWDMEELRRKSLEMEIKLKSESRGNSYQNLTTESIVQQNDVLLQNLDATKEKLEILSKQYGELEAKSKADVKRRDPRRREKGGGEGRGF